MSRIFSSKIIQAVKAYAIAHKVLSTIIVIVVVAGGYFGIKTLTSGSAPTKYVLAAAQKGTLITSVSGSGQVAASDQLDIKPQVSGTVTNVAVGVGQQVKEGDLLFQIDSTDALKAVRDAQANLQASQISLEKLKEPATQLSLIQAQNSLIQAQQSQQTAQDALTKSYDDAFNTISNTFLDLPGVVSGLNDILNGTEVLKGQANAYAYSDMIINQRPDIYTFRDEVLASYQTALSAYNQNLQDYKNANRSSSTSTIDTLLTETYNTTKLVSGAVKDTQNFLDIVDNTLTNYTNLKVPAILSTHESNIQTYTGTTNTDLGNLLNIQNTIQSDENAITNAGLSVSAQSAALAQLKAGADPLDLQSQELDVQQKQNALSDAQQNLSYYSVRAPFDGVVAQVDVIKGDSASSGTAAVTLITSQKIAQVALNEIDVAKVQVGQKATLTFDALPDLTVAGQVAEIDTIGTVSQGVVSYNVQISFDTQDARVKPSMGVTANIVTGVDDNVLLVPNSAVKTQGNNSYVEVLNLPGGASAANLSTQGVTSATLPQMQPVQVGNSNDTMTEITSGLNEGDLVVTRTITSGATTAASTSSTQRTGGGGGGIFFGR